MMTGGRRAASQGEDDLLSRLYQCLADEQAARLAEGYDAAAGLSRYRAWLNAHAAGEAAQVSAAGAGLGSAARPGPAGIRAGNARAPAAQARPEAVPAAGHARLGRHCALAATEQDADRVITELYRLQYRSLVRLAALLVPDVGTAEEVVQDAFVALHAAWPRLGGITRAESYLWQSVVSRCRSAQRHHRIMDTNAPTAQADLAGMADRHERPAVVAALRRLPARQREALVLRLYADLSEAQIAETMGISTRTVRLHIARALSALRQAVEPYDRADRHERPRSQPGPDPDINATAGREPA